ncbi:MAG: DUF2064 domain-containing protein [Planctomycetales bacterium]|nr:DUF2064 domain-containing protein [Planctomycetales bacterium]
MNGHKPVGGQRQLGVFAKYWEPGKVKTRLAATLGPRPAADLYRAFLETLLTRLGPPAPTRSTPTGSPHDFHRVLAYTPGHHRHTFARLAGDSWTLEAQTTGDLGARMHAYFENAWRAGYQHVLLIGSDAPTLPAARVTEAFAALQRAAVVLGPTGDGGYYLVGARQRTPDIFAKIDWGSANVWNQTLQRLRASATSVVTLEPWYDVDDQQGLRRLQKELDACPADVPLQRLRHRISSIVN